MGINKSKSMQPTAPSFPEVTLHNTTIKIIQNDITREKVDAITNAANNGLWHGGGVAGAISRAGGRKLDDESRAWVKKYGSVETGDCALTSAGDMTTCKFVIHAVGPVWGSGRGGEQKQLYNAFFNTLKMAAQKGFESVSIPAISSGIFGFPKDLCAKIAF